MGNQTNFSNTNPGTPNPAQPQVGQQPGVAGTQGTSQGVNPPAGSGDGQMTLEDALAQLQQRETDINRLKSGYDKRFAETDKQSKERIKALQDQMNQALTAKMDETEKTKFNLQYAQQQLAEMQREKEQLEQDKANWQSIVTVRDQMIQAGIPAEKLDITSQEALATSAWAYLFQSREDMRRQLEELQRGQQSQPQQQQFRQQQFVQPQQRQPVITNPSGQPVSQAITYDSLKQSYETALGRRVTDEEFLRMAERGKIDLTQIR